MGSLSANRVQPNPAFRTTGVDYCGPFHHKTEARNKAPHKCYIAVLVWFSTKSAHLEVVQDLTTDSFIAALGRFISLRASPRTIWSHWRFLNSRPLCPISENAESLEVLTPAHFLKGSSYTKFPEPDITHLREGLLSRWQRVTQMQQYFWKRWSSEYLSLLQERKP